MSSSSRSASTSTSALTIRYRGRDYTVAPRPELAVSGFVPWCIEVDGAWYQLGAEAADAIRSARDFLRIGVRTPHTPRTPNFLATTRYPLLLTVDGVAIRGRPANVDPNRWGVWLFESAGRPATECGTITAEQTLADVIDLAKIWLRSAPAPD